MGSPTDGAAVGAPGPSSAPVGQAVAQSGAGHTLAVAGLRVGAVAARCLGGARGYPVAAGVDGQRPLFTPSPARNPASGKLFCPVSWTCTGRLFALKAGSCLPRVPVPACACSPCPWHTLPGQAATCNAVRSIYSSL